MTMDDNGLACVCGFGDEFFTLEGGRPICTVCGGWVGQAVPDIFTEEKEKKKTILVVDDQAFFRARLNTVLKSQGYEVIEAADGLGCVKVVADIVRGKSKAHGKVSALILDLVMPGDLDGFQTLAVVKAITPDMPVIVITASPPKKDLLQNLARLGAKKYINKAAENLDTLILNNLAQVV
jgi:CheY-like chemotaxis protein